MATQAAAVKRKGAQEIQLADHALVAWALADGTARWEPWDASGRGELCFGGLRYTSTLDDFGVPALSDVSRPALQAIRGAR